MTQAKPKTTETTKNGGTQPAHRRDVERDRQPPEPGDRADNTVDEASEESFPASDPPAYASTLGSKVRRKPKDQR